VPKQIRFLLLAAMLSICTLLVSAQQYNVTDLGTFPGGSVSEGYSISKCGHITGYARFGNYNAHAIFWTEHGGLRDIGAIPPESNFSVGEAINFKGHIAGYSTYNYPPYQFSHAVVWIQGNIHDLGTLPGSDDAQAMALNNLDEVVGFSVPQAFLWTAQKGMQSLGTLPGGYYSQALGINDAGQVVGFSNAADGNWHGFRWTKSQGMRVLRYLPGGKSASANGINQHGQIAGGSSLAACGFCSHAVVWNQNGSVQDLGVLPGQGWSTAFAINDFGQVVGWSGFTAFIWSEEDGMQDLSRLIPGDSGWQLTTANAINDKGQITGQGTINGEAHGFLLTPTSGPLWGCN